ASSGPALAPSPVASSVNSSVASSVAAGSTSTVGGAVGSAEVGAAGASPVGSPASTATVGSAVTCAGRALQAARASPTATTTTNTGNIRRAIAVIVLLCTWIMPITTSLMIAPFPPPARGIRCNQPPTSGGGTPKEHQAGKDFRPRSVGDRCGLARQARSRRLIHEEGQRAVNRLHRLRRVGAGAALAVQHHIEGIRLVLA